MRSQMNRRHRQRGVAMMVAILLVAFGTILAAAIGFKSAMAARRSTAAMSLDQSLLVAEAAESLAAYALREDAKSGSKTDDPSEPWGQPIGPLEVLPGIVLEAYVEDATGKFNLNSLVAPDGTGKEVVDPIALEKLQSLMQQVGIDAKWASLIADWIDPDTQPLPDGAEDSLYASQDPPYRAPNTFITTPSELLALPGFGREQYLKIRPFVTALPRDASLNVCSAPGVVLDAMVGPTHVVFGQNPEQLLKSRESGCFPTLDAYAQEYNGKQSPEWQKVQDRVSDASIYFRLTSIVTIGSAEFTLYSLLQRDAQRQIHVVTRSFSPD
jgi:general secretion pathway protein K